MLHFGRNDSLRWYGEPHTPTSIVILWLVQIVHLIKDPDKEIQYTYQTFPVRKTG